MIFLGYLAELIQWWWAGEMLLVRVKIKKLFYSPDKLPYRAAQSHGPKYALVLEQRVLAELVRAEHPVDSVAFWPSL